MSTHNTYIELPSRDLTKTQAFYGDVFGWGFTAFGDRYIDIKSKDINGGFSLKDTASSTASGSALVILYRQNLVEMQEKIIQAGGEIVVETFSFPGGSRFHFMDITGNELAVWSSDGALPV